MSVKHAAGSSPRDVIEILLTSALEVRDSLINQQRNKAGAASSSAAAAPAGTNAEPDSPVSVVIPTGDASLVLLAHRKSGGFGQHCEQLAYDARHVGCNPGRSTSCVHVRARVAC